MKMTIKGAPMQSRETRGYELDVQHLERLLKAVSRDLRFSGTEVSVIDSCGRSIIRALRPYLAAGGPKKRKVEK